MAKTLTDFLKSSSKDKVAIGYADLKGYQAALDAMRLQYDEEFIEGGSVELSNTINQASDVTLSGSVDQQGFIDDQSLKQMYMDVGFFGGCPMAGSDNENFMGAPPGSTSGVFAGGTCTPNSDDKFCPVGTQESLFADGKDYKVGVFFDVEGKGTQYIEKFYPDSDLKATYTPNNPSLSELIQNGMLWVEIAFPASDNAGETQGKVMVAKVIGNARSSGADNTIYINAPLALHSNFSSVFSCQEGKSLYNEQYDSMQGGISGFGPASVKEKFSQNGGVKDIHIQSVQHCRVRLWVSKDMGTAEVPEEMYDRNYKQSPVNQVQSTTTGAVTEAVSTDIGDMSQYSSQGAVDVFLDPGHTADHGREWPGSFTGTDWGSGDGKIIADIVGFTKGTQDSLEHMLNVKMVNATAKHLKAMGLTFTIFDEPSVSNNTEINHVYTKSNSINPGCFVSIHNNAAGGKGWTSLSCNASGSVGCYKEGRPRCKQLTDVISNKLTEYRKSSGGPDNRGSHQSGISVGVLSNASQNIPATLLEVCFYDNKKDLLWTCQHLDGIGKTIAEGIKQFLGK